MRKACAQLLAGAARSHFLKATVPSEMARGLCEIWRNRWLVPCRFCARELSCSLSTVEVNPPPWRRGPWAQCLCNWRVVCECSTAWSMSLSLRHLGMSNLMKPGEISVRPCKLNSLLRLWCRKAKDRRCVTDWLEQTDFSYTFWKLGFLADHVQSGMETHVTFESWRRT